MASARFGWLRRTGQTAGPWPCPSTCKAPLARAPSIGRLTVSGLSPAAATPTARLFSRSQLAVDRRSVSFKGRVTTRCGHPTEDLIVYAGRSNVGQVPLFAARPDGTPVDLPHVMVQPGGYRFLPNGTGLVYLPGIYARDFWLLDLGTARFTSVDATGEPGNTANLRYHGRREGDRLRSIQTRIPTSF